MKTIQIIHLFTSPLFLIIALLFRFVKTKRLNAFFGHRNRFENISTEVAENANKFVANIMILIALILIPIHYFIIKKFGFEYAIGPSIFAMMVGVFIVFVVSEIYLSNKFEK
jgi:uncharacterized membrane protein